MTILLSFQVLKENFQETLTFQTGLRHVYLQISCCLYNADFSQHALCSLLLYRTVQSTAYTINVLVHNHHIISILKSLSSLPSSVYSLNSHYLSLCLMQLLSLLSGSTTNFIKVHSLHLSLTAAFSIFNLIPMQRRPKS